MFKKPNVEAPGAEAKVSVAVVSCFGPLHKNHYIRVLITPLMMKRFVLMFAALGLLFSCTPENNPGELTTTGEALEVTDYSAILTGYANLPLEMGGAEVGVMYDKNRSFESAKKAVATGLDGNNKFTVPVNGLEQGTTYYFKSYVQNGMAVKYGAVKSFTTQKSTIPAGAVDLGIVMTREDGTTYKLYWATSNLCKDGLCSNPEDYGDYYAWGETEPKLNYSWSTYKWCKGNSSTMTKYCNESNYGYNGFTDNKTVLAPEDDAAAVALGGSWRMPTKAEQDELRSQCTWTWTTNYNGTGVRGRLVTGPNGNSIFLPAAGYRAGTSLYYAGSYGYYWSSSLSTDSPYYAYFVYFNSGSVYWDLDLRCDGQSVRPVSE